MNKDELEGKKDQVKGKVKQGVGDMTGNERLHDEGVADEASGDVQEGFGRGRRKVGEAIEDLGDKLKK
ncbi:MAG: CsbD family protein [Vicinamibacterales bacterium]